MLASALSSRNFVVTAELGPPRSPDAAVLRAAARALIGAVDAVNITDNQAATVKVSPVAAAAVLLEEGLEPILQLTTRDRNLLGLQAELLGAHMLGVRSLLVLGGDPLKVGPYEELATHVRDLDARGMLRMIGAMNAGRLAAGEELDTPTDFLAAGAANPLVDTVESLESKIDAGAAFFQSNIVYDVDRFAEWFAPLVDAGIPERAPFLVGVTPPRSTGMLQYMHDRIPGIEVDDATFARMRDLEGDAAKAEGIVIAAEIVARLRDQPGVAGVHLMAPGWEAAAVPAIVQAANLRPTVVD